MASSLCQIPDQPGGETKTLTRDGSEDEDYSASLCAVLRQRRASVRRSRKSRTRRPSSPFVDDRPRRRSSIFTTSSGDTAISMEEGQPLVVTQEQIFENIHLHKEVLGSVKQQPLGMRRKLKIVHQAKGYIKQHEGQLQERLAQSKSTRDIYARFTIFLATKWLQLKREAANTSNILIPWELRIKEIESHFGSVVASYFTFLRWLFWVNLVIAFILLVFVIIPEYLTADPRQDGERKIIMEEERQNASNLLTLWEFEGILKYSPIFYGYYSNVERPEYKMPLAYFLTGLIVYIYSFVAILRKMAENSRMSKLSEKEDECIFSWKLFTGWDFMIGNTETAQNRIASVILGFKEALLEEAEKKKKLRNWRIITLRAIVNICVVILLAVSAFAVVSVVSRSSTKARSWWRENETTIVVTVISITFPVFFELLGILEHYHPRKQLRLQLARIMLLNLLNLYSLIFALFSKIEGMSKDLDALKPTFSMNTTNFSQSTLSFDESLLQRLPLACFEVSLSCNSCNMPLIISYSDFSIKGDLNKETGLAVNFPKTSSVEKIAIPRVTDTNFAEINYLTAHNLIDQGKISKTIDTTTEYSTDQVKISKSTDTTTEDSIYPGKMSKPIETTTEDSIVLLQKEMKKHRAMFPALYSDVTDETSEYDEIDIYYDDDLKNTSTTSTFVKNDTYVNFTITDINTTTSINDAQSNDDLDSYSTTEVYESTTDDIINATLNISNNAILTSVINSEAFNGGYIADNESELTTSYSGQYYTGDIFTASVSKSYMETTYPNNMHQVERNVSETVCPKISFNCSVICGDKNVTQVFKISNCTVVEKKCYTTQCRVTHFQSNTTSIDLVYEDERRRRMYNLTKDTKRKLLKLCWETMFGQELVKLTMMDLVFVFLGTLFIDFFRSLFVRYMNRCWCWDLEKKFPEYGDFKIAENILHLINNQGMVWMGMFFSPGLVVLNVSKLMIMMYLRSWAVMTCNVPHEVVFRVSKSNNFYLALLLTMLFLCVLPVGYSIVWVKPSWHCGPFSEYDKIYYILTSNIYKILPKTLNFALEYVASPAIVIPLLVLLILIIYYLTSLTNSLREANNDLKIQLRRERTEERRKMFQLADTRRRVGSSALDNTPFARWKRALPGLPLRSMDSDERNTTTKEDMNESYEAGNKKRGGSFVKIVSMALDKKSTLLTQTQVDDLSPLTNLNDKTDMDFNQIVKIDELTMLEIKEDSKKETNPIQKEETIMKKKRSELIEYEDKIKESSDLKANIQKQRENKSQKKVRPNPWYVTDFDDNKKNRSDSQRIKQKSASQPSGRAKHSDSLPSIVPRITISTTESDDDLLQEKEDTCPDPDPE